MHRAWIQNGALADLVVGWLEQHSAEVGFAALFVVVVAAIFRRRGLSPHDEQVRVHAAAGRLREAGDLQLRKGNLDQAHTLYLRGEIWDRASFVAERLGHTEQAAELAEKGGDAPRAAGLFEAAQRYDRAAEAWRLGGRPDEAARLLALDPGATPEARAQQWQDAYNHLRADDALSPSVREERMAVVLEHAHKAFLRAGDDVAARRFAALAAGENPEPVPTRPLSVAEAATPSAAESMHGNNDGRYELGRKLGEGGMGVVYQAVDNLLGRTVAMKLLPEQITAPGSARQLFQREAKAAAALTHPNIVVLYDFGVLSGRPFLSMEYVDGGSLADALRDHPEGLPLLEVLKAAQGLLRGLSFAHRRRIVHRDIKPANILRASDGSVKLTDFGIAKIIDTQRDQTTLVAGTPPYMAPEQLAGKGITTQTDVFAVGVTLYQLLTGRLPFEGAQRDEAPTPPTVFRSDIPALLEDLIVACLKNDKRARPSGCTALLEVLDRITVAGPLPTRGAANDPSPRPVAAPLPFRPRKRPQLEYSTRGTRERIGA
ncbi:MAG: serine/threonine-protein kinase [Myxococcota bacterium]